MFETSSPSGLMIKARQDTEMFFGEMEAENIETTKIKRQDQERRLREDWGRSGRGIGASSGLLYNAIRIHQTPHKIKGEKGTVPFRLR